MIICGTLSFPVEEIKPCRLVLRHCMQLVCVKLAQSYVACTLGVKYIGYNMIAFGVANFIFSVIVGVLSRRVAVEALVGVATVLQLGLAVFLLVWVPDRNLVSTAPRDQPNTETTAEMEHSVAGPI